jgi:hypothetical protein
MIGGAERDMHSEREIDRILMRWAVGLFCLFLSCALICGAVVWA